MDEAAARRVLGLVGLGVRARGVVVGVDRVREAVRAGRCRLALVADDAGPHSREKILPLCAARGVTVVEGWQADALGQAAGKERTAVVGVTDPQLAKGIRGALTHER